MDYPLVPERLQSSKPPCKDLALADHEPAPLTPKDPKTQENLNLKPQVTRNPQLP